MEIGTQITAWRLFKGHTQAALARAAGLTRAYISRVERGDADPALSTLRKLAMALEISPGVLIDSPPPREPMDRFRLEAMAQGAVLPGASDAPKEARSLARMFKGRRQALGLYKPRGPLSSVGSGRHSARWLKARLGPERWDALLRRIDKIGAGRV